MNIPGRGSLHVGQAGLLIWALLCLAFVLAIMPQSAAAYNPMIHSSLSTASSKWGGDWGTVTGKYGEFTCSTCHGRLTGNVKRIKKTLLAPNGSDQFPIEADNGTVILLDLRDGSSDLGDDSGGHSTSDKICEACHSQNQFHNYDTSNNSGGLDHYNQRDCIYCHRHSQGFAASCDDCHGNPPSSNAHLTHAGNAAGEYGFVCSTCHPVDHDGDASDIMFTGIAATWNGATYDPAQMQCASLYCHGSATADWDAGSGGACGDCHGDGSGRPDGIDEPAGGSHLTSSHLVACSNCHSHDGDDVSEHVNGQANANGDALVSGAGSSVSSYSYGSELPSSPDPDGYKYSGGSCSNSCHADLNWGDTPACTFCHTGSGSGHAKVGANSPHSTNTIPSNPSCESCHFSNHRFRTIGTAAITWYAQTMGSDYTADGKVYIQADGTSTEAEACWACHQAQTPDVSEWDGSNAIYDYGSVTTDNLNWFTTNWSSANFDYKDGGLTTAMGASASTHGTNGGASGVDQEAAISCTRCHDVHATGNNGFLSASAPYLRGSWKSSEYYEDGAPGTYTGSGGSGTDIYISNGTYGPVPRASTDTGNGMGGYWIDQNSGSPVNGDYTTHAGLCTLCHGDGDTIPGEPDDVIAIESLWVGHKNTVAGGNDDSSSARNIFSNNIRIGDGDWNGLDGGPYMGAVNMLSFRKSQQDAVGSIRNSDYGDGISPPVDGWARAYNDFAWGVAVDASTVNADFHSFSCSKCHNPHASRLPRLMMTNCLDTRHNSWDDSFIGDTDWGGNNFASMTYDTQELAYASSAQNCHRYIDVNTDGNPDEAGWNSVTPW